MKAEALWSGLRDKLELCSALLLAAAFTDIFSADCWRRVGRALGLWFGLLRGGAMATPELTDNRLAVCRGCPLFWPRLGTCGSPLAQNPKLGCWCHMASKARLAEATCWLDDELGEAAQPDGWLSNLPHSLNAQSAIAGRDALSESGD